MTWQDAMANWVQTTQHVIWAQAIPWNSTLLPSSSSNLPLCLITSLFVVAYFYANWMLSDPNCHGTRLRNTWVQTDYNMAWAWLNDGNQTFIKLRAIWLKPDHLTGTLQFFSLIKVEKTTLNSGNSRTDYSSILKSGPMNCIRKMYL